jgi:hypothetical protein
VGYALSCPACGAKEVGKKAGRFACAFCGAAVVPRLMPGTLCAEDVGALCSKPAQTLCRSCARPLCDRHNDPKASYWHASLTWKQLCPKWTAREATEWERLCRPLQRFPLDGFSPFEWVPHDRRAQYELGVLEGEIHAAIQPLARAAGGDVDESACRFESLCGECEREVLGRIEEAVLRFAERYARLAFTERIAALRADAEQSVRYVECFLRRPISRKRIDDSRPWTGLGTDSSRADWDRCGQEFKARIEAIDRLRAALGGA